MVIKARELKSRIIRTKTVDINKFLKLLKQAKKEQNKLYQYERLENKIDSILNILRRIENRGNQMSQMSQELDQLASEVEEVKTVQQSSVVLIHGLAEKIKEAGTDPAKLKRLADDLDASSESLAEAITANTPAEEETHEQP